MPRTKEKKKERKDRLTPVTREYTINLHKRLHGVYVLYSKNILFLLNNMLINSFFVSESLVPSRRELPKQLELFVSLLVEKWAQKTFELKSLWTNSCGLVGFVTHPVECVWDWVVVVMKTKMLKSQCTLWSLTFRSLQEGTKVLSQKQSLNKIIISLWMKLSCFSLFVMSSFCWLNSLCSHCLRTSISLRATISHSHFLCWHKRVYSFGLNQTFPTKCLTSIPSMKRYEKIHYCLFFSFKERDSVASESSFFWVSPFSVWSSSSNFLVRIRSDSTRKSILEKKTNETFSTLVINIEEWRKEIVEKETRIHCVVDSHREVLTLIK